MDCINVIKNYPTTGISVNFSRYKARRWWQFCLSAE